MEEIRDEKHIENLVLENDITRHLKNINIKFKLLKYEKGEVIIKMGEVPKLFQFVVKGTVEIYGVREDGSMYPVRYINGFTALGDLELSEEDESQFFVEAKSSVLCLAIPLKEQRQLLLEDNSFLRFVLKSISRKMTASSITYSKYNTFEEKLIYYMREECEDNMITSVENTRFQLRCSRRQMQRVLKKLLEEGKIKRVSKGCYKLL